MKFIEEPMPGLKLLQAFKHLDERGEFVKTFNETAFETMGISLDPKEIVFSVSAKDVVRGMHFQTPESDHKKLVSCAAGAIIDVVVDLRKGSPTYGEHASFELNDENRHILLIPRGFAHGFLSLKDQSLVTYCTDTGHDPSCDSGIRWNSFGYEWPVESPIVSEKDQNLIGLDEYQSPFVYSK